MALDPQVFKRALASWASGVTIVTSQHEGRVHGMTVSAFSSVSLDPPLILVCADRETITLEVLRASRVFCVNVLRDDQSELSDLFASKELEERRFEGLDWKPGTTGCPRLPGALIHLDCRVTDLLHAGDHVICLAEVEAAEVHEGRPLLYFRGGYLKV